MGHHNTILPSRKSQPVLVGESQERPRYLIGFESCLFRNVTESRALQPSDKKSKDSRSHDPINRAHRPTLRTAPDTASDHIDRCERCRLTGGVEDRVGARRLLV